MRRSSGSGRRRWASGKEGVTQMLEVYSARLAAFDWEGAREAVEEWGRWGVGSSGGDWAASWAALLSVLPGLALAERSYQQLAFLLPKGLWSLGRKDGQLKTSYQALRGDLALPSAGTTGDSLGHHLSHQLHLYISARVDMIQVYQRLSAVPTTSATSAGASGQGSGSFAASVQSLLEVLTEVEERNQGAFAHPTIAPLATVFAYELETLVQLLRAEQELGRLAFLPSLLHLKEAHSRLRTWLADANVHASVPSGGVSLLGWRSPQKTVAQLGLCLWLQRLYHHLMAKFSLYFVDVLAAQGGDLRQHIGSSQANLAAKLAAFQRKADLSLVALVADTNEMAGFAGIGYAFPGREEEAWRGLETFPLLHLVPAGQTDRSRLASLLPSAVMEMEAREGRALGVLRASFEAEAGERGETLLVGRVDEAVWLLLLSQGHRLSTEPALATFLRDFAASLSTAHLCAQLKTPAKA